MGKKGDRVLSSVGAREESEETRSRGSQGEEGECLGRRLSVWEGQEKQEACRGTEGPTSLQSEKVAPGTPEKVARELQRGTQTSEPKGKGCF